MDRNVENQKKALQNVAFGHNDDAVTPDDFENITHPPLHHGKTDETEQTSNKTDSSKQIPEKSIVTTKPTPNQSRDFEDDFHDPYWN